MNVLKTATSCPVQVFDATNTTRERRAIINSFAKEKGYKVSVHGWRESYLAMLSLKSMVSLFFLNEDRQSTIVFSQGVRRKKQLGVHFRKLLPVCTSQAQQIKSFPVGKGFFKHFLKD